MDTLFYAAALRVDRKAYIMSLVRNVNDFL